LRVAVTASQGCVTLAGLLDRLEQRAAVNEIAGSAEGVSGIDDQLRTADAVRPRFQ
jgi:osmotically-inducible protein OsmY